MTTTKEALKEDVRRARALIRDDRLLAPTMCVRYWADDESPCDGGDEPVPVLPVVDWLLADPDRRAALRTILDAS
jgi:hypothetical protein